MLNVVALVGRLAHTPETKVGKDEKEFVVTSIAVPNGIDQDGNEKVMFVDIVCYNESQKAFEYVDTGDQICVQGRLDVYTWTKKDGSTGYGTRVIVNNLEFGAKKKEAPSPEEVGLPDHKAAPKSESPRRYKR